MLNCQFVSAPIGLNKINALNLKFEYLNNIASDRTNLDVGKYTYATKILLKSDSTTYGVEVSRNNATMRFYAKRSYCKRRNYTPRLSMLSGIGSKDHLDAKNIETLVNLPMVEQNLQDHYYVPVTLYADEPVALDESEQYYSAMMYLYNRTGYLAEPTYSDIFALYSAYSNTLYADYHNQFRIYRKNTSPKNLAEGYVESVAKSILEQSVNRSLFEFTFHIQHPYSRGNISLNTSSPHDYPLIYYNRYSDRDLDSAAAGIRMLTQIVNTTYFKSIGATLGRLKYSACDHVELDSADYWKCICYNMASTLFHLVGTAKMGTNPIVAGVDDRLNAFGVSGLRVVDASVIPEAPSGYTNAPVVMMAERPSDMIKEDHNMVEIFKKFQVNENCFKKYECIT